jgi:hypothetical protein
MHFEHSGDVEGEGEGLWALDPIRANRSRAVIESILNFLSNLFFQVDGENKVSS